MNLSLIYPLGIAAGAVGAGIAGLLHGAAALYRRWQYGRRP
jgi:hypothetical protein